MNKLSVVVWAATIWIALNSTVVAQERFGDEEKIEGYIEEWNSEQLIDSVPEKMELIQDAWAIFQWRLDGGFISGNDIDGFKEKYYETFAEFVVLLMSEEEVPLQIGRSEVRQMADAYESNEGRFEDFSEHVRGLSSNYGESNRRLATIQLRLATAAYSLDEELWKRFSSITGIFPFC